MNFFRFSGILVSILLICSTVYFLLPQDDEFNKDNVLDEVLSQNLENADSILEKYRKEFSFPEWSLYKGYVARANGKLDESSEILSQALVYPEENVKNIVVEEIFLNRMLNAYLEKDQKKLALIISQGKNHFVTGEQEWINMFRGIEAYLRGNPAEAKRFVSSKGDPKYFSPLMKSTFKKYFPGYWVSIFLARCEIALGNGAEARMILESALPSTPPEGKLEIHFLLGMSYIKDSESHSFRNAVLYYKLAFEQFENIKLTEEKYEYEREKILKNISGYIDAMISERSFDNLTFYSSLLVMLEADDELEHMKQKISMLFSEDTIEKSWENVEDLAFVLSEVLKEGELKNSIQNKFEERFEHSLNNSDVRGVGFNWKVATIFCDEPDRLRDQYIERVINRAFDIVCNDSQQLEKTKAYIEFLGKFEPEKERRLKIAESLSQQGQRLWMNKFNRSKAISFLKLIKNSSLAPKDSLFSENLEIAFNQAYLLAVRNDNFYELKDIMEAADELELANIDIKSSEVQANQLEDAIYLFKNKKYTEAKKKAKWILKIDPQNIEVKKLLGMIAYEEAEYKKAYSYLKDVVSSEINMIKALAVIHLLNNDVEMGNKFLSVLEKKNALDDEIYFRLAFGALIQDKPMKALEWFDVVDQSRPEVLAGKVFAAFELDSWRETIDLYEKLPKLYKALDGYQGIVIESYTSIGDISQAEKKLDILLKEPPEPGLDQFPDYFQTFKKKKLDQWNRYYVAALFYKVVKGDPEKALIFFDKIENPTPSSEIEKAEILMSNGDFYNAKNVFLNVLEKVHGTDQERDIKIRILPHLAKVESSLGYYPEAIPVYQEYFSLEPKDDTFRILFAKVLMAVKRYDLALEQFQLYGTNMEFTFSDVIDYMESLIHTNQFNAANTTARDWIANNEVPLYYQIKLARLLIITKYKALIDNIFATIAERKVRTVEENQQLIYLWMDLGNYDDALSLASVEQRALESTPEGVVVLFELYTRLSKNDEAIQFAEQLSQLAPTDHRIADILEAYESSPAIVAQSTKLLKERLEDDPDSITLQLDYAKNLMDLAIETSVLEEWEDFSQSRDLHTARSVLESLTKSNQEIPEAYFLLGKVYYLLDEQAEAKKAYKEALKLDISYVKVYQHLALVYEENDDLENAVAMVRAAAKFDPNNAKAWVQLGGLLFRQEKYVEAINALKNAIRYAPNDPEGYIRIAEVYLKGGNTEFSIANLEDALELSPKNIEAIQLMILALYDENYVEGIKDLEDLEKRRFIYFDKLEAFSPEDAKAMRKRLNLPPK